MRISTVEEMRNLDSEAVERFGIPEEILMENAGNSVYFVILKEIGIRNKKFTVVSGTGNNGGDGFVVARKLYSQGGSVKVFVFGNMEKIRGVSKRNLEILESMNLDIYFNQEIEIFKDAVRDSDVIVDALLGTGISRKITGILRDVIDTINKSGNTIVSVDIPSGVNGDTGEIMGISVKADYTVTFGLPKVGNILYPGFSSNGKLFLSHISFPPTLYEKETIKIFINEVAPLPERKKDGHKGDFGDTLFIAGSRFYLGAPLFSSLSFLKSGGGYSRLATVKSIINSISCGASEVVFIPLEETDEGSISIKNLNKLINISKKVDFVVIGPGLSLNQETQEFVRKFVKVVEKPVLIDGDGLTAISKDLKILLERKSPTVLTPHPGEMSRLVSIPKDEILKNRINILRDFTKKFNSIVVLKGAHSLIGYPDGRIFINTSGNSGMATPGSGDVLSGIIPAMYGIGFNIEEAVRMGGFIHGFSGDLIGEVIGEDGITARDIMNHIPEAMKRLRDDFLSVKEKYKLINSI